MVRVTNQGQAIKYVSQYALLCKLHLIILYLPLEGDAVFVNNYPMYVRSLFIHTLPFTIPYICILKISIFDMRDFNRPVCNRYKDRTVEVVVFQYLIAHSEKRSKDISSSRTLLTLENSG